MQSSIAKREVSGKNSRRRFRLGPDKDLSQARQPLEEALKIDEKDSVFAPAERAEIAEITSKTEI